MRGGAVAPGGHLLGVTIDGLCCNLVGWCIMTLENKAENHWLDERPQLAMHRLLPPFLVYFSFCQLYLFCFTQIQQNRQRIIGLHPYTKPGLHDIKIHRMLLSVDTINIFKDGLNKFWSNQDVLYDYNKSDLHGIEHHSIITYLF